MTTPAETPKPKPLIANIEEASVVGLINARALGLVQLEERLRTLQLFDTTDSEGREVKRSKRLRVDNIDVQLLLERAKRYAQFEHEIEQAQAVLDGIDDEGKSKLRAIESLTRLRLAQQLELKGIEDQRGNMRRDYSMALAACTKLLSDAASIRQREHHHDEMIKLFHERLEAEHGKSVDALSDEELEREAAKHGEGAQP